MRLFVRRHRELREKPDRVQEGELDWSPSFSLYTWRRVVLEVLHYCTNCFRSGMDTKHCCVRILYKQTFGNVVFTCLNWAKDAGFDQQYRSRLELNVLKVSVRSVEAKPYILYRSRGVEHFVDNFPRYVFNNFNTLQFCWFQQHARPSAGVHFILQIRFR